MLKCFKLSNIIFNLQGVSLLYIGIQYSASIMSRKKEKIKREKTSTDRMLTKIRRCFDVSKEENACRNK